MPSHPTPSKRFFLLWFFALLTALAAAGYFIYYSLPPVSPTHLKVAVDTTPWEPLLREFEKGLAQLSKIQEGLLGQDEQLLKLVAQLETILEETKVAAPSPKEMGDHLTVSLRLLPGDNIWSLAARFTATPSPELVRRILALNNIADPAKLKIGSLISIPLKRTPQGYEIDGPI